MTDILDAQNFNKDTQDDEEEAAAGAVLSGLGFPIKLPELRRLTVTDKSGDRVKDAQSKADSLSLEQRANVESLQITLEENLATSNLRIENLADLIKRIKDERAGIVRNDSGEIIRQLGKPYFGKASQDGFKILLGYLQEESLPDLYARVAQSKGTMVVDGPIKLPIYDEGPLKGKAQGPEVLIALAANGRIKCDLQIDSEKVPTAEVIAKLKEIADWSDPTRKFLEKANLEKQQEIARRTIKRNGFPSEWKVENTEQCAAAMYVARNSKETARLIESIDFLREKIGGSDIAKKEWTDLLKQENLPAGVSLVRENDDPNGRVTNVKFRFPKTLEPSSPEFRDMLREMHAWSDAVRPQVEQMMLELNKGAQKPENVYAWMDIEYPFGQVYMGKDGELSKKGDFKPVPNQRATGDWKHFNLIEMRCQAEEKRNPATQDLEQIKLTGTLRYCDVPLWSYLNLYKPQAEGTELLAPDDKWRKPQEWVSVKDGPNSVKMMQAKDVQFHADCQAFWHYTDKAVTVAMDASMLLGVGELAQAVRIGRAIRTTEGVIKAVESANKVQKAVRAVELLEKVKTCPALLKTAQLEMQAANSAAKFHASKQIVLGLTAPLNNVAVRETPGLNEASFLRSMVFMFDITKGTLYNPPKALISRALYGPKLPTMGEQFYQAAKLGQPPLLRGLEKSGHYGFMATQVPFGASMIKHIWGQVTEVPEFEDHLQVKTAQERLAAANRARDTKTLETKGYSAEAKVTAKTLGDNLEKFALGLGKDQSADVQALIKEVRPLLEAPTKPDGELDVAALSEWRAKRQKFVEDKLAPILLATGKQIADAERARADLLPYESTEFRDNKTFTAEQIHLKQTKGVLNPQDKALKDFAAAALICVSRDAWGNLDQFGPPPVAAALQDALEKDAVAGKGITSDGDTNQMNLQFTGDNTPSFQTNDSGKLHLSSLSLKREGENLIVESAKDAKNQVLTAHQIAALNQTLQPLLAEISKKETFAPEKVGIAVHAFSRRSDNLLFSRETLVPAWTVTKNVASRDNETIVVAVPEPPNRRGAVRQQIMTSEMMTLLEKRLLPTEPADSRVCAGELLCRAGLPAEIYASTLKSVITAGNTTAAQRTDAIIRLSAVASAIQNNEVERESNSRIDKIALSGLAVGNSSKDLRNFLQVVSADQTQDLNDRALARFMVMKLDRAVITKIDAAAIEKVVTDGQLSYADFVDQMTQACNKKPKSSADIDRKLHAILALMEFCDQDGNLIPASKSDDKQETMSSLTIKLAEIVDDAKKSENAAVLKLARQQMHDTREKLQSKDLKEEERHSLESQLKQQQTSVSLIEKNRILSVELAIKAAEELIKPSPRNGLSRSRIVHMDQSAEVGESTTALKCRQCYLDLLKTPAASIEDVANKRRIMEIMPLLLREQPLQLLPESASKFNRKLGYMRADFASAMASLLVSEASEKPEYSLLWQLAQDCPPLRSQAIKSLVQLGAHSYFDTVKLHLLPENEPDAGVRLEAARAMPKLSPGGSEGVRQIFQEVLNRDGEDKKPLERDPVVALAMQSNYDPVGLAESPKEAAYKKALEEVSAIITQGEKSAIDIRKLLETEKYKWLTGAAFREELRSAKDNTYSNVFSHGWDKAGTTFGFVEKDTVELEMIKSQEKVVSDFRAKFGKLLITAFEDEGAAGKEAREVLFAILTDNGGEWNISDRQKSDQLNAGRFAFSHTSKTNLWAGRETFEGMRLVVAKNFADFCRRQDNGKPLSDNQLKQLEIMLYAGLRDPNTPSNAKEHLMEGIAAIAQRQTVGQPERAEKLPARGTVVVLECLKKTLALDEPTNMTAEESKKEIWARNRLSLQMIDYIGRYNCSKATFKELDAIALATPGVDAEREKIPSSVKQRALDVISTNRDRTYPLWLRTKVDESGSMTIESRTDILIESKHQAQMFIKSGNATADAGKVEKDVLFGLQDRRDEAAISAMFAAVKGYRISKDSDPVGIQLVEMMQTTYSERVRQAAALAIALQSNVRSQRDEAIAILARMSVAGSRPGYRRDAEDFLRILDKQDEQGQGEADRQAGIKSLKVQRDEILQQMRKELVAKKLQPDCSTSELMDAYITDGASKNLRLRLAVALSNLGLLESRSGACMEAQENTLAAVNLFSKRPVETEYEDDVRLDFANRDEFRKEMGNSEYLSAAINAFSNYGISKTAGLGSRTDWKKAFSMLNFAQDLRRDLLGEKHFDVLNGSALITRVSEEKIAIDNLSLQDRKQQISDWQAEIKALEKQGDLQDKEKLVEDKKYLESKIKEAEIECRATVAQLTDDYERLANYQKYVFKLTREHFGSGDRLADVQFKRAMLLDKAGKNAQILVKDSTTENTRKYYQTSREKNEKSAETCYQEVIKHRSASTTAKPEQIVDARIQLAHLYLRQNRTAEYRDQLEEASKLNPGSASKLATAILMDLSRANLKLGDEKKAAECFAKIAKAHTSSFGADSVQALQAVALEANVRWEFKQYERAGVVLAEVIKRLGDRDPAYKAALLKNLAEVKKRSEK